SADWRPIAKGCAAVVHAAARVHVMNDRARDPLAAYRDANVEGTLALARQAVAAGVNRFVFISSIKVNGDSTVAGRPFRADDSPAPLDPYGVSKAEAEDQLFALGRDTGMEIVVVRPALIYGPGVRANFAAMMNAVACGLPLPLGSIRNHRSLLFVGNLSDLVLRLLEHPLAAGRVFLASDGEDIATPDMLRRLGKALGRRARLVPVPPMLLRVAATLMGKGAQAQRLLGSLQVDIEPTRRTLGWTPPFSVDAGFATTAADFARSRGR
ncbi:MAG: NAD-dependent epimerase/dehydratase family protein, partial [Sphingosinicella sp.]